MQTLPWFSICDGSDYSAFTILDLTELEICATYKEQLLPETFALILKTVGKDFGACQIVVENAGGGGTTLQELKHQGYANKNYGKHLPIDVYLMTKEYHKAHVKKLSDEKAYVMVITRFVKTPQ